MNNPIQLRDHKFLQPEFRDQLEILQARMIEIHGQTFRTYFTLRDPWTQARLYRQSRTKATIDRKISELVERGAAYAVRVLESVGPCHGPRVTGAAPGESWHQYGYAADMFRSLPDGRASWYSRDYVELAHEAVKLGLTPGHLFKHTDSPHIQHWKDEPGDRVDFTDMVQEMGERFGPVESDWLDSIR